MSDTNASSLASEPGHLVYTYAAEHQNSNLSYTSQNVQTSITGLTGQAAVISFAAPGDTAQSFRGVVVPMALWGCIMDDFIGLMASRVANIGSRNGTGCGGSTEGLDGNGPDENGGPGGCYDRKSCCRGRTCHQWDDQEEMISTQMYPGSLENTLTGRALVVDCPGCFWGKRVDRIKRKGKALNQLKKPEYLSGSPKEVDKKVGKRLTAGLQLAMVEVIRIVLSKRVDHEGAFQL